MTLTTPRVTPVDYAGHRCLQLTHPLGTAVIALHGAQLLSWVPTGHNEVFWLSPQALPEPAAIRGGVPLCWPWFGKQGMPVGAMQHGPVRNRRWELASVQADADGPVCITLVPAAPATPDDPLIRYAAGLQPSLHVELGETLTQTLLTRNPGLYPFALTQALHSYFAVQDAAQVRITGLESLHFDDKLDATRNDACQHGPLVLEQACDRVYRQHQPQTHHHYTLTDPMARRSIHIRTEGSQSVVTWNPGAQGARQMADVPDAGWRHFFCLEVTNAGSDTVLLQPGAEHRLTQTLAIAPLAV